MLVSSTNSEDHCPLWTRSLPGACSQESPAKRALQAMFSSRKAKGMCFQRVHGRTNWLCSCKMRQEVDLASETI